MGFKVFSVFFLFYLFIFFFFFFFFLCFPFADSCSSELALKNPTGDTFSSLIILKNFEMRTGLIDADI